MRNLFHYDTVKSKINIKNIDKKYFYVTAFFVVLFILLILMLSYKKSSTRNISSLQKQHNEVILKKLNEINDTLLAVKNNPVTTKQQQHDLVNIEESILSLQKTITEVAKSSEIQKISSQIASVKDDVNTQINDLKKSISESMGNKQYLDASALPFHVIAIDVIGGQAYVSVDYANHIFPLAIGDILTGWRVSNSDYDSSVAEFVNEKNQFVRISMKGA